MSNMLISPGVQVNLKDESQYTPITSIPSMSVGIVGGACKGPINEPTLLTSVQGFIYKFGTPIDQAGLTAVNVLSAGCAVYYCRFAGSSKAKLTQTIAGTSGNLTLESLEYGTYFKSGNWQYKVEATSVATEFKLTIQFIPSGSTDGEIIVDGVVLSCSNSAENYYANWKNDYFHLKKAGETDPTAITAVTTFTNLTGQGNNGVDATLANNASAVGDACDLFSDTESYSPSYFATPGYSSIGTVRTKLVNISNARKDCIFIIDHSLTPVTAAEVVTDLSGIAGDYNSWVAMWAMVGGTIRNLYNNNAEEAAYASAVVLPAIGSLLANGLPWTAPAGVQNLELSLIANLSKVWTQADRDTLYAANINPILNYKGLGYTALGQKSGQTKKSALDRLNVVQLVNYTKKAIEMISVNYLFAPIDEQTFNLWTKDVTNFLAEIKARRGLYDFKVKMDWETVTPEAVNNNLMPGIVKIKPTKVSEFIDVDLVIKNYSDTL